MGGGGGDLVGENGYSSDTVPMTTENLTKLQLLLDTGSVGEGSVTPLSISELHGDKKKRSDLDIDEPSGSKWSRSSQAYEALLLA